MNQLADDLRAARALIDTPEKWHRGSYYGPDGAMCVLGACRAVDPGGDTGSVAEAIRAQLPEGSWGTWAHEYNDHPDTTHADIMRLFDKAIAAAEQQS